MYILYHINTLKRIGHTTYNSLADAMLGKEALTKILSETTIGIADKPEFEGMKIKRVRDLCSKKGKTVRTSLRVVGD